jgi:hypothetical protein
MASAVAIVLLVILGALMVWGIIERKKVEKWLKKKWDKYFGDSPAPAPAPGPAPAPAENEVEITDEGVLFPGGISSYTVEGTLTPCKENPIYENQQAYEASPYYVESINFDDFKSSSESLSTDLWGVLDSANNTRTGGWCELAGFAYDNQNQKAVMYSYNDDGNSGDYIFSGGKCNLTGEGKEYACIYKEVKDVEGKVTGYVNDQNVRLEKQIYDDYINNKGKIDTYLSGKGLEFKLNTDNKLEIHTTETGTDTTSESTKKYKMVITPGKNTFVSDMLLGTVVTMVSEDISMPDDGIPISYTSYDNTRDDILSNMKTDRVEVVE